MMQLIKNNLKKKNYKELPRVKTRPQISGQG